MEMLRHIAALLRERREIESRPALRRDLKESVLLLLAFMRSHLAMEERLLRALHRPNVEGHRAEQATYLGAVDAMERRLQEDGSAAEIVASARELRWIALEHAFGGAVDLAPPGV
jgi:hypothetical protein